MVGEQLSLLILLMLAEWQADDALTFMNASNPGISTIFSAVVAITSCTFLVDGCSTHRETSRQTAAVAGGVHGAFGQQTDKYRGEATGVRGVEIAEGVRGALVHVVGME